MLIRKIKYIHKRSF